MSLRERLQGLEERERRLLGIALIVLVVGVVLAPPIALYAVLHSRRSEVEDCISDVQVVRNGGDQPIPFDASSQESRFRINHAFRRAAIAFHHCATQPVHR